jgi:hypothetical protein
VERRLLEELRAEVAQARGRPLADRPVERVHQARLADPGLAAQQDDLALARPRQPPALEHHLQLVRPADQRRQPARQPRLEPPLGAALADHAPHPLRLGETLEDVRAEIGAGEQAADQPGRVPADHDRVGRGQGLQAGGEVGRVAHRRAAALGGSGAGHVADHDGPGVDPDPRVQLDAGAGLQPAHRCHELETGPDRALGVVLVGLRKAEVGEHPVPEMLRHVPAERLDDLGAGALVGADDAEHLLPIERTGEPGRVDHVAEQDRQLAMLGAGRAGGPLGPPASPSEPGRRARPGRPRP